MAIAGFVVGFFVSLLPERMKEHPRLQGLAGTGLHIASGLSEMAVGAVLWARGFLPHLEAYNSAMFAAAGAAGEIRGLGIFGVVDYVAQPLSLLYTYLVVEGVLRTFVTIFARRCLGVAPLGLLYRAFGGTLGFLEKEERRGLRGPMAPDRVFTAGEEQEILEIQSWAPKDWSDRQILEYGNEFYIMTDNKFALAGLHYRYRYRFRKLQPGEIIRGSVVKYETAPHDGSAIL
jgi:hypothetical protein